MLSWTCHICGEERPDAKISVYKSDISEDYNLPDGIMFQNVRYCNDNIDCSEKAQHHTHLKKDNINISDVSDSVINISTKGKHDDAIDAVSYSMHMAPEARKEMSNTKKFIYTFLIYFVLLQIVSALVIPFIIDNRTFIEEITDPFGILVSIVLSIIVAMWKKDELFKGK